jgi:hypothetical protein
MMADDYTEQNTVEINIVVLGDASVTLNDDPINEKEGSKNKVKLTLTHENDVLVTVNGEDFHIEKPE